MNNYKVECCYKNDKGHLITDSHFFTAEDGVEAMDLAIDYFDRLYPKYPVLLSEPTRFDKVDGSIVWRVEYE